MKQKKVKLSVNDVKTLFEINLNNIMSMALDSDNVSIFKAKLKTMLASDYVVDKKAAAQLEILIDNDGKIIHELSTGNEMTVKTISCLWDLLTNNTPINNEPDLYIDLYHLFINIYGLNVKKPSKDDVLRWMNRWPSGIDDEVKNMRIRNKDYIIDILIKKIDNRKVSKSRYVFREGMTYLQKKEQVNLWWNDYIFHLVMAVRTTAELNEMLRYSLSDDAIRLYKKAEEKKIPLFITPYYLSLLNTSSVGYNDEAIRSYVLYSKELVDTYGNIRAWEKEDVVQPGKPNAAGWLLPYGHNIHRRYPDVAILIPDSIGRACGGLCASCQRMYDFQSERLNFRFDELKPKESWNLKLRKLMEYFENDTKLCDILITGGDALMSQNKTLRSILDEVYHMALRKREANMGRPKGEKYAEIHRVRLGTRLPVYLPMRINDELLDILREFKEKASRIGIEQFFIQTHFQTPLEVTTEAYEGIKRLLSTGWIITNQLVYNVAASRRGHTAKLRKVLNEAGVLCYYTFAVKGFMENYAVFTPNCRLIQEQKEEKVFGEISHDDQKDFINRIKNASNIATTIKSFCNEKEIPFVATDRSVLNLPGIGKSMTFRLIGITPDGKRILEFDHDHTRNHSPIINKMGKIYICENKSLYSYLCQLQNLGEDISDYQSIWNYTEGVTEYRFPLYDYAMITDNVTDKYSNLSLE